MTSHEIDITAQKIVNVATIVASHTDYGRPGHSEASRLAMQVLAEFDWSALNRMLGFVVYLAKHHPRKEHRQMYKDARDIDRVLTDIRCYQQEICARIRAAA